MASEDSNENRSYQTKTENRLGVNVLYAHNGSQYTTAEDTHKSVKSSMKTSTTLSVENNATLHAVL